MPEGRKRSEGKYENNEQNQKKGTGKVIHCKEVGYKSYVRFGYQKLWFNSNRVTERQNWHFLLITDSAIKGK